MTRHAFKQFVLNTIRSHLQLAKLHHSGSQEFTRRGLLKTAKLWHELAVHHVRCAQFAEHQLKMLE